MDTGRFVVSRRAAWTIGHRVRQFAAYARPLPRPVDEIDGEIRRRLTPEEWRLVARLAPADRAHLWRVRRRLEAREIHDADLLKAALLHDVGKADAVGRVRLAHRVLRVLLGAVAPGLLDRLARPAIPGVGRGLYLAVNHARIGAALARRAGCSARVCWLIAEHDGALARVDPVLRALAQADREV